MFKDILPEEVEKVVKEQNRTIEVLDVREYQEVVQGKIPGARHIPLGEILQRINELDKTKEYIVVCRSGNRSSLACEWLSERGFQVKNMTGGMINWKGEVE
jgi:rhodanese-related sulfurtransferase